MLHAATLVLFPSLMVFAALSDLFTMTISNRISIALVAIFLPLAAMVGLPWHSIVLHLACGGGVLVLTFAMFAFGWIGGGDAKLAAATAVWMGLDHLADYGVQVGLFGGVLTLSILVLRHFPLPVSVLHVGWLQRLHERESGVPYGIALAAAGLFLYPDTGLWHAALIV
jgi:prepilin peptidase CpaA